MGGPVSIVIRREGVVRKRVMWTSHLACTRDSRFLLGKSDRGWERMARPIPDGESDEYDLENIVPECYGIAFIDFDTRYIGTMQSYTSPDFYDASVDNDAAWMNNASDDEYNEAILLINAIDDGCVTAARVWNTNLQSARRIVRELSLLEMGIVNGVSAVRWCCDTSIPLHARFYFRPPGWTIDKLESDLAGLVRMRDAIDYRLGLNADELTAWRELVVDAGLDEI